MDKDKSILLSVMKCISWTCNQGSVVLVALMAIAVSGLVSGSPLRLKSNNQTDFQKHSRFVDSRYHIKTQDRHHYNGHDASSDQHNGFELVSDFEWPKPAQFAFVPDYKPQPVYKPYDHRPQRPNLSQQTLNYDPSSIIYPLVYYTEEPVPDAYSSPFHSSQAYPQSPFFPLNHADGPSTAAPQTQYRPIDHEDFEQSPPHDHRTGYDDFEKSRPGTDSDVGAGFANNDYFKFPKFDDFFLEQMYRDAFV